MRTERRVVERTGLIHMSEFTKGEALAFIGTMRLTFENKVGFKWLVEKLSGLEAYVASVATENEWLNAYLDWADERADYESYLAANPDTASRDE